MEEGPWIFRGYALILKEFDGSTAIPATVLDKLLAWVQIHRIPPLYHTHAILTQLAGKVRGVVVVEMKAISTSYGDFHCVRVRLEASKPLVRFVTVSPEGQASILIQVKYEKIPRFCAFCGRMGHDYLECGSGEHLEKDLQYRDWMVAPSEQWHLGTPRVRTFSSFREGSSSGPVECGGRARRSPRFGRSRAWEGNHGRRERPPQIAPDQGRECLEMQG